jgi:hypothetical protein
MTFFEWAKKQVKRNDLVGDVARDMVEDARINGLGYQTFTQWQKRVWNKTSHRDIRRAFIMAGKEYREYQPR